jgi:hypothetical protein
MGMGMGMGMLLWACTSELDLTLEGKQCRQREPRCLPGFACDVSSDRCVRQVVGGAGGAGGAGGSAGAVAGAGGAPDVAGSAGTPGAGGAGMLPGPVDSGSEPSGGVPDAASGDAAADAARACTPVLSYVDADSDGVGVTATGALTCPGPGWVQLAGDCRDDRQDVFPGQLTFSGVGYPDPTKPDGVSYDYDCDGVEEPDLDNTPPDLPPSCGSLAGGVNCTGSGYLPRVPARAGQNIEPRCGSTLRRTCEGQLLSACEAIDETILLAFRCR